MIDISKKELERFVSLYIEAIHFTDDDTDGIKKDTKIHSDAMISIENDCFAFLNSLEHKIGSQINPYEYPSLAAHFWLTRNGHGAGFWDGDWSEPFATIACDICGHMGESLSYLGDDNLLHLTGE